MNSFSRKGAWDDYIYHFHFNWKCRLCWCRPVIPAVVRVRLDKYKQIEGQEIPIANRYFLYFKCWQVISRTQDWSVKTDHHCDMLYICISMTSFVFLLVLILSLDFWGRVSPYSPFWPQTQGDPHEKVSPDKEAFSFKIWKWSLTK